MAVKKHTLDVSMLQESFFDSLALIGIVSAIPAYRFCWLLNTRINLDFSRRPELDIITGKGKSTDGHSNSFPIYQCQSDILATCHTLYRLRTGKESLLPEIRHMDYLWSIKSNYPEEDAEYFLELLRKLPEVQLAQPVQSEKLVNSEYLLW